MTNRNDEFRRDNPSTYGRQNQNPQNQNMQNQNRQNQNLQGQRHQGQQDFYGQQASSRYSQPYGNDISGDYEGYGSQASGSFQQRYQGDFEGGQRLQGSQERGYQEQIAGQTGERSPWDEGRGYGEQGRYEPGRYATSEYAQRNLGGGYRQQESMGQSLGGRGYGQGYGTSSGYGQSEYGYGQGLGNQGLGLGASGYRDEGEMSGYRLQGQQGQSQFGTGSLGNRGLGNLQSYRGRGPKNYTRSDERIIDDINERLTNDDDIDASDIEVKCVQGVVTLEGSVEERWMKHRAEDIADSCGGVRQVENRLALEALSSLDTEGRQGTSAGKSTQSRSGTQSGKPGSSSGSAH